MTAIFYQDGDVTISASVLQGKGGTYELSSISGVESGFRGGWLAAFILAGIFFLGVAISFPRDSVGDWVSYTIASACFFGAVVHSVRRPVFVRTTTGLAPLAFWQSSKAREQIAAAFVTAKLAASRTGAAA